MKLPIDDKATSETYGLFRLLLLLKGRGQFLVGATENYSHPDDGRIRKFDATGLHMEANFRQMTGVGPSCMSFAFSDPDTPPLPERGLELSGGQAQGLLRRGILDFVRRGGVAMLHDHPGNPTLPEGLASLQRGAYRERTGAPLEAISAGGSQRGQFLAWLDHYADFFLSLRDENNRLVPVIWRPFHEINGNWFWWNGPDRIAQLLPLWRDLVHHVRDRRGVHNVLYCWNWSSGRAGPLSIYWPGDAYVDILSIDHYSNGTPPPKSDWRPSSNANFLKRLGEMIVHADRTGKPLIMAEYGAKPGAYEASGLWQQVLADMRDTHAMRKLSLICGWRYPWWPLPGTPGALSLGQAMRANGPLSLTHGKRLFNALGV